MRKKEYTVLLKEFKKDLLMTKKILLARRLQTDLEWREDCQIIAEKVFDLLNLSIPHFAYKDTFVNFLATGLEYNETNAFVEGLLENVPSHGADNFYMYEKELDVPNFDIIISPEYVAFVDNLILRVTEEYYEKYKKELLQKLEFFNKMHIDNGVVIYPDRLFRGIIKRSFNFNCETFQSSFDKDEECLNDYLSKHKVGIYGLFEYP